MTDIEMSLTIGALAAALDGFQGEVAAVPKDSTNPHLRTKFADLPGLFAHTQHLRHKWGLAVIQAPGMDGNDVTVTTIVTHASGEWVKSTARCPFEVQKGTTVPQSVGIAVTYLRRYAFTAMFGIVADDDTDGATPVQDRAVPAPGRAKDRAARTTEANDLVAAREAEVKAWTKAQTGTGYSEAFAEFTVAWTKAGKTKREVADLVATVNDRGVQNPALLTADELAEALVRLLLDGGK